MDVEKSTKQKEQAQLYFTYKDKGINKVNNHALSQVKS